MLIVGNILIDNLDPLTIEHPLILNCQLLPAPLTQLFGQLDDGVGHILIELSLVAPKVVEYGFCSRPQPSAHLHNVDLLLLPAFLLVSLMGLEDVVSDCHPVVRLEDLAGRQPGVLRVSCHQGFLVVVLPNHLLERQRRFHLADLEV